MERADRRYKFDYNWGKGASYYTFGEYYNPRKMGTGRIIAVNEYVLNPQEEFAQNIVHKNMHILSLILKGGSLRHNSSVKDRVTLTEKQCHYLSIADEEVRHGLQNEDAENKAEILELWVQRSTTVEEEATSTQQVINFNGEASEVNKIETIVSNASLELSTVTLQAEHEVTFDNEKSGNVFILAVGEGLVYNGKQALADRDAITEVQQKYSFKAGKTSATLFFLKSF